MKIEEGSKWLDEDGDEVVVVDVTDISVSYRYSHPAFEHVRLTTQGRVKFVEEHEPNKTFVLRPHPDSPFKDDIMDDLMREIQGKMGELANAAYVMQEGITYNQDTGSMYIDPDVPFGKINVIGV